jgi:glycosyltransferase involved in cell wall biosynthesis
VKLHQFVPTLEGGAVGAHVVEVQRLARAEAGIEGEIFAEQTRPPYADCARPHQHYGSRVDAASTDVLLYHVAIGSVVADFLLGRHDHLLVDHHNITPPELLSGWDDAAAAGCSWGRAQLRAFADRATMGVADSDFNAGELDALGYRETATVPILFDPATLQQAADEGVRDRLATTKTGTAWLFVGRVAPHKAQHDVVKAFAAYRRVYDPRATLHLVGSPSAAPYSWALERFIDALGLSAAVDVAGPVSDAALAAYFEAADVFVVLSGHEGFCVPVLEAWHHRTPVVALARAAVPETVGNAGVLLPAKDPALVAAAVARVMDDANLRANLVNAGSARLATFGIARAREAWLDLLRRLA